MADPCVASNEYIGLDTVGTPAVLEATLLNPETTFSATEGDHTVRNVTDNDTVHEQTQTVVINNAGSAPARGIIVVTFDPIWVACNDPGFQVTWMAELIYNGVQQDVRNLTEQQLVLPVAVGDTWLPIGVCVGQLNIAAGGSATVTFRKQIENTGDEQIWSFLMGGDKLVAQLGY